MTNPILSMWALVVIDLQRDLCYDSRRQNLVAEALPNIIDLVDAFRDKGWPVFFTRFQLPPDDEQFARFGDQYCVEGTPGANFIDEISPRELEIVVKRKHSAFFGTDLEDRIRGAGGVGVVLAGLQTQICILTTAADANNRGLRVLAASDAVVSTRDDVRLQALEWIEKYVGAVSTSDEIIQLVRRS